MAEQMSPPISPDTINVVTWNTLLDYTRARLNIIDSQSKRVEDQAKTLIGLGMSLDVVMLQEVEGDHGRRIAELTGNGPGAWKQYNRGNEHIGTFGELVGDAEFYDIGNNRKVVIVRLGDVAICGLHLSARPKRWYKRVGEVREFCEVVGGEKNVVAAGDFNGPEWEPARIILARQGFKKAFAGVERSERMIYPTEEYRDIMWTPNQQRVLRRGVEIDDILVKGDVEVVSTRTFVGPSDHPGGVATIRL